MFRWRDLEQEIAYFVPLYMCSIPIERRIGSVEFRDSLVIGEEDKSKARLSGRTSTPLLVEQSHTQRRRYGQSSQPLY
jgi:hypothetical protein